jgi:hypothetical protein
VPDLLIQQQAQLRIRPVLLVFQQRLELESLL